MFNATEFFNEMFGNLHVLTEDNGEIWFIGREVTEKLGYANSSTQGQAITNFVRKEDRKALKYKGFSAALKPILWSNPNDFKDKWVINECGFYDLLMHSEAKLASDFQHWVTHEVLPSIRKNGGYILGQEELEEEQQQDLVTEIQKLKKKVDTLLVENDRLRKANRRKTEKIKEEKRKAEINRLCRAKYKESLNDIDRMTKLYELEDRYVQLLIEREFTQAAIHRVTDHKFLLLKMILKDAGEEHFISEMEETYKELETPNTSEPDVFVSKDGFLQSLHGTNVFLS